MSAESIKYNHCTYNLQSWSKQKGLNPVPIENKPAKKIQYVLLNAAGTNNNAPIAIQKKPYIIPLLKPARFKTNEAGIDITRYAI